MHALRRLFGRVGERVEEVGSVLGDFVAGEENEPRYQRGKQPADNPRRPKAAGGLAGTTTRFFLTAGYAEGAEGTGYSNPMIHRPS